MVPDAAGAGCEAVRDGDVERFERFHLPVEPGRGIGTVPVGPAQARSQAPDAQLLQPSHRLVQPRVLIMEPLVDSELGGVIGDVIEGFSMQRVANEAA